MYVYVVVSLSGAMCTSVALNVAHFLLHHTDSGLTPILALLPMYSGHPSFQLLSDTLRNQVGEGEGVGRREQKREEGGRGVRWGGGSKRERREREGEERGKGWGRGERGGGGREREGEGEVRAILQCMLSSCAPNP